MSRLPPRLLFLLALLVLASPVGAPAVVHTKDDGSGNVMPPPNDPGFDNVGVSANGLSGVYLGNRWVLAADHVGEPASFEFQGIPYVVQPGSRVRIQKPPGTQADLELLRLISTPPLPSIVLSTTSPAASDVVTLIGHGWSREAATTCWNSSFAEVTCSPGPPPPFEGYKRDTTLPRVVRWGLNEVTTTGLDVVIGTRTTRAFSTTFDASGITFEAQTVNGDSGGAAFLERGSTWELVGIQFGMGVYGGQPSDTAVFGNLSVISDLFYYRDEIDAVIASGIPQIPTAPWPLFLLTAAVMSLVARRSLVAR